MTAPNKAQREACWLMRDEFWKCLDSNDNDREKCTESRKRFETGCAPQWVKYFDRRRDYLRFKDKVEKEGFEPIPEKRSKTS